MAIPNSQLIQTMLTKATAAMQHSYAPYSMFHVGACLQSESGELFSGTNIENASYSLALCAEASALAALITSGQQQIKTILITTSSPTPCPPCGACRQRLIEFAEPSTVIHLCSPQGLYQAFTLGELLPHDFNSKNFQK